MKQTVSLHQWRGHPWAHVYAAFTIYIYIEMMENTVIWYETQPVISCPFKGEVTSFCESASGGWCKQLLLSLVQKVQELSTWNIPKSPNHTWCAWSCDESRVYHVSQSVSQHVQSLYSSAWQAPAAPPAPSVKRIISTWTLWRGSAVICAEGILCSQSVWLSLSRNRRQADTMHVLIKSSQSAAWPECGV